MDDRQMRSRVPPVPTGRERWGWYGPALLWMLSSVGSGSVLFTPRVGSRYGYALLWAALFVILTEWIIIREVGRYTVVTGRTLLDGFRDVPGPRGWAIWAIFVPQLLAAVVTIAGIAALAGSALMIALPGAQGVYATALVVVSIVLVVSGRYKGVEQVSSVMAGVLVLTAVTAALLVQPSGGALARGAVPTIPGDFDFYFVLPWLGFILSGAAGVMWFSYWVAERGYGGEVEHGALPDESATAARDRDAEGTVEERMERLSQWMRVMSTTAAIAVGGGAIVVIAFLTLGAEVLRPEGVMPEGIDVAAQLTRLLSEVWGELGYWVLLVGIVIALWGTVLADQDGWGRTFADATLLLLPRADREEGDYDRTAPGGWLAALMRDRERMKNAYAVVVTAVLPLIVFWAMRDPVQILSIGGIVAATHTPVIVFITHYINRRHLPEALRPGPVMSVLMIGSGLFFLAFAVLYLLDLAGVRLFS